MTEKLFYADSHMTSFTANVLECCEEGDAYRVRLDRTAFFPEGGGQYADTGILDGHKVTDVREKGGIIWHITDGAIEPGKEVDGEIDWDERFMKMQQHSGEHIVSGLVHARFGYNNVGFHLGSEDCTMDFDGEITKEELREIERKANEAVAKNLEILVTYPSKEELQTMEYRSKIEIEGQVRIVTVPGYDVCACCAPHVKCTGEIGMIKLVNVQRYKGGVRVTMLCGFRALEDYEQKCTSSRQISAALCAPEKEIAEAVEHLKKECSELKLELAEQQKELLIYRAKEVDEQEAVVCLFENQLSGEAPRFLMNLVLDAGHDICAVFVQQGIAEESGMTDSGEICLYRYVIGSRTRNMQKLVKELNAEFNGRGGGKPEMVQGSLRGNEDVLRAWIQKKGRILCDE